MTVTVSGALDETLIYNDAGLVVRQIEKAPAATATFSSPTARSRFPEALASVYTYPGGATLGSTANFTSSGLLRFGLVPGFGTSNAGIDIVANAGAGDRGSQSHGRWTFQPDGPGTRVHLEADMKAPPGLGPLFEWIAARQFRTYYRNLRRELELPEPVSHQG